METYVISEIKTNIIVRHKRKNKTITVDNSKLKDFYPFNNLYKYEMDKDGEHLKLRRNKGINNISYGIDEDKNYVSDIKSHQCNLETMTNPTVKIENQKVIEDAEEWGISTIDKPFNLEDINNSFNKLGDRLSMLSNSMIDYYLSDKDEATKLEYLLKDRDTKVKIALQDCGGYIEKKYCRIGEIYVMLKLMKKMARHKSKRMR